MLESLRILIVDDSDDERLMYELTLVDLGAIVRGEETATAALEAMLAEPFDVLVSDLALPTLSGYDLIREVRALAPGSAGRIPAIAVTGFSRESDKAKAIDAGFDRFFSKPCGPLELASAILELVRGRGGSSSTGA